MQSVIPSSSHLAFNQTAAVVVLLMVLAPYWLGPIMIKFKQSRPASPEGMQPVTDTTTLSPALAAFVAGSRGVLEALGFGSFAVLRQGAGVVVLAEVTPGTVATALAIQKPDGRLHALLGFTTRMAGGAKIRTSNSPLPAITPTPAGESRLRLPTEQNAGRLYAIHVHRVAEATAAGKSIDRLTIGDPVAYQHREELSSIAQFVDSGYWRRTGERLTLTWKGAFLSAWRLLPPWRGISRRRDERLAHALPVPGA
jgi:hypothetical protein